jgi:hypothetical protein
MRKRGSCPGIGVRERNAGVEKINGLPPSTVPGKTLFEAFPHLVDTPTGQARRDAVAGRRVEMRDRRYFAPARGVAIVYDADYTPLRAPAPSSWSRTTRTCAGCREIFR